MKYLSRLFIVTILVLNMLLAPWSNAQTYNNNAAPSGDPIDTQSDNNGFAVDVAADCHNIEEDQPISDPGDVFPPKFRIVYPAFYPFIGDGWAIPVPLGYIDWRVNSFYDFLNVLGFSSGQNTSIPPDLKLKTAIFSINEGDAVDLQAEATHFASSLKQIQYAWWVVEKKGDQEILHSLNGVVAGGDQFSSQDLPISNGSRCGNVTRKVKNDSDRDGMDDQWELRYAPNNNIQAFKSGDDLDQDGYVASSFEKNDTGEIFQIAPDAQSQGGKKFRTGDGEFTNLEEYIWGTNPLDADSDDDGFVDEADVAGVGQSELHYLPPDVLGQSNTIEVDAMGETLVGGSDGNLVTLMLGYRSSLPTLLQQDLTVNVVSDNQSPQLGQKFQVRALPFGTNANAGNLEYDWKVTNGDTQVSINTPGAPCSLLGFNNVLECIFGDGSVSVGENINFSVKVFDPKLGITSEGTLGVPIGDNVVLTSNPTLVPQYPIDKTGKNIVAPSGNAELGERWVEVTAVLTNDDPLQFNFDWYVDDEKMVNTCSNIPLNFTGRARPADVTLCGVGTNILYFHAQENNAHTYHVEVKVTNKTDGDLLSDEDMKIFTDPTETPYPGQSLSQQNLLQAKNTSVMPNENIVVSASNVELSDSHSYEYLWSVDGQAVSSQNNKSIVFTAKPDKKQYEISLQVVEKFHGNVVAKKTASTTVVVAPISKFDLWRDSRLATVQEAFYPFYHTIAGNTSLFLVALGIMIVVWVYILEKKKIKVT